ncbi:exportin-1 [Thamnidium elegans]|nr:exportin-1 [Thamnidium elegans]
MNSLVNSSFTVKDFDNIIQAFYEGDNETRTKAQTILTEFQNYTDSWQLVDQILEQSSSIQAKFIALGILEEFIIVRWNTLPMDQRLVMRNYIVKHIIELSSNESTLRSQKIYLNKLDLVLVQILKKDWPQYWPSFIQEIVDSSLVNTSLCENNMKILKLLSEEVFDFSIDHMTMAKMQKLKKQMVNEFGSIFDLCKNVLSTPSTNIHLVNATLETLLKFISWIPIQFVYQQDLIQILESNLSGSPIQRNLSLQCFTEIITLDRVDQQYNDIILNIYAIVTKEMTRIIPSHVDIAQLYNTCSNEDQHFIEALAIFLTTFLSRYQSLVESTPGGQSSMHQTLQYLLKISYIQEREVWKMCLECWAKLTYDIVQDMNHNQSIPYQDVLHQLGIVLIENMVRPDDVFVVENDNGEITRSFIRQSDTTVLSKSSRDVFGLLTQLYPVYIQTLIQEKLSHILTSVDWYWDELFRICWAIGAISGTISEQQENQFLESIVAKDLVSLLRKAETNQHKDNYEEWVVASCLLYIAGQYTRFLKSHWDFLWFLLQKIFTFMQHDQSPIREMACDSFLKITQGCRQEFIVSHQNNPSVFQTLLNDLKNITRCFDSNQACVFYKAMGTILSELPAHEQLQSLVVLMAIPNETITGALQPTMTSSALKSIINALKINVVTCEPVGPIFRKQLQTITPVLIQCYQISSQQPQDQLYKRIRQLILELFETFMLSNECLELQDQNMISQLIQFILLDYKNTVQVQNREPQVLSLLTCMFEKMQDPIWPDLLKETIEIEFVSTLPMITSNFVDYPEFRHEFYRLLRVLNRRCFIELFQSSELFQLVIDSIMWGTKHTIREISQIALQTCLDMINTVAQHEDEDVSSQFFEMYYVRILRDILEVLVDPDCRNGFNYQSQVLSRLFELVQEGEIYTRLFNPDQVANPLMSNIEFLQQYTLELLCTAFPLLQKNQIEVLVMGMFEYSGDLQRFQNDIRDFLIDIREVDEASVGEEKAQEEINAELELLRSVK